MQKKITCEVNNFLVVSPNTKIYDLLSEQILKLKNSKKPVSKMFILYTVSYVHVYSTELWAKWLDKLFVLLFESMIELTNAF